MSGHLFMELKENEILSEGSSLFYLWMVAFCRMSMSIILFFLFYISPNIRRAFALSAIGHISYLITRFGAVFRLGSIYLEAGAEREKWQASSDFQRLKVLCSGQYIWLGIDSFLSVAMIWVLFVLRMNSSVETFPSMDSSDSFYFKSCLFV